MTDNSIEPIQALILAGGHGSRFDEPDKHLTLLDGQSLLRRAISGLGDLGVRIVAVMVPHGRESRYALELENIARTSNLNLSYLSGPLDPDGSEDYFADAALALHQDEIQVISGREPSRADRVMTVVTYGDQAVLGVEKNAKMSDHLRVGYREGNVHPVSAMSFYEYTPDGSPRRIYAAPFGCVGRLVDISLGDRLCRDKLRLNVIAANINTRHDLTEAERFMRQHTINGELIRFGPDTRDFVDETSLYH